MGLFLQKNNIILDYKEDISESPPRIFYPKDVWQHYVPTIHHLGNPNYKKEALCCLNELVTNALYHLPYCIDFLSRLREPTIFAFCAIPQVMAVASLQAMYNNYDVFKKRVKIRKGLAVQLILECTDMTSVLSIMLKFIDAILADVPEKDPTANDTKEILKIIKKKISRHRKFRPGWFQNSV